MLLDKGAEVEPVSSCCGDTPADRAPPHIAAMLKAEALRRCPPVSPCPEHELSVALLNKCGARLRRAKCEEFGMGQLARLGAGSMVCALDRDVVRMVLDLM